MKKKIRFSFRFECEFVLWIFFLIGYEIRKFKFQFNIDFRINYDLIGFQFQNVSYCRFCFVFYLSCIIPKCFMLFKAHFFRVIFIIICHSIWYFAVFSKMTFLSTKSRLWRRFTIRFKNRFEAIHISLAFWKVIFEKTKASVRKFDWCWFYIWKFDWHSC